MYQGGLGQRQEADDRHAAQEAAVAANAAAAAAEAAAAAPAEAPLAAEGPPLDEPPSRPRLPSFYSEDTPQSANEMWQRLHSDPLFAIKQQVGPAWVLGVAGGAGGAARPCGQPCPDAPSCPLTPLAHALSRDFLKQPAQATPPAHSLTLLCHVPVAGAGGAAQHRGQPRPDAGHQAAGEEGARPPACLPACCGHCVSCVSPAVC